MVILVVGLLGRPVLAHTAKTIPVGRADIGNLMDSRSNPAVQCGLSYYYLIEDCAYVTVVEGIAENETYGLHFDMTDVVAWHEPCDTAACLTLDTVGLVFFDVLASPENQAMNVSIYASDSGGEPVGQPIGNRDFTPIYTAPQVFTTVVIDFTNAGMVDGLDLSGCRGNFLVMLTWKNSTGHPLLVLDNVSECVTNCPDVAACCQMGFDPYLYPRRDARTCYYGTQGAWSKQDPVADPGGAATFGYLDALWTASFCKWSAATLPTTWGAVKSLYR
jgi:hypothetical protein